MWLPAPPDPTGSDGTQKVDRIVFRRTFCLYFVFELSSPPQPSSSPALDLVLIDLPRFDQCRGLPIALAARPQLINGSWRKPLISRRQLAKLRNEHLENDLPWEEPASNFKVAKLRNPDKPLYKGHKRLRPETIAKRYAAYSAHTWPHVSAWLVVLTLTSRGTGKR
jgi:hypothetical protein